MAAPSAAQIAAAVAAAHVAVTQVTSVPLTLFISEDKFDAIVTQIVSAALNAPGLIVNPVNRPVDPNQPLRP